MAATPKRNVRIESSLWEAAKKRVSQDGLDISTAIRLMLQAYIEGKISIKQEVRQPGDQAGEEAQ